MAYGATIRFQIIDAGQTSIDELNTSLEAVLQTMQGMGMLTNLEVEMRCGELGPKDPLHIEMVTPEELQAQVQSEADKR